MRLLPLAPKFLRLIRLNLSQFLPFEKNSKRDPSPQWGCASKTWSFSSACKSLKVQHPTRAEIWSSKKLIWVGMIPHWDIHSYWTKIHQTFFSERGKNWDKSSNCPILNIFPFWRHSSSKFEVVQNRTKFCMFLASKIVLRGPQYFGPGLLNWTHFPSYCIILRQSADGAQRSRNGKK